MSIPTTKEIKGPKKPQRVDTKRPHKKGLHRVREIVPLTTSPKCKKVFWPRGTV